jgi:hypothetical protein
VRHNKPRHSAKRDGFLLIVAVVAALFFSQHALAQSGRRQSKSVSSPPPPVASEPKTEQAVKQPPVKPTPSASVIVGGDRFGSSIYTLASYVDVAVDACMDRLKDSSGLEVIGGGNMSRKDAVDRAKKEQSAYVLWLEIKVEDDANTNTALIGYTVFMPQTGKIVTSGRVYLGNKSVGTGNVGIGLPSVTKRLPIQYQLKEGGREVADRVKGKFQAPLPD